MTSRALRIWRADNWPFTCRGLGCELQRRTRCPVNTTPTASTSNGSRTGPCKSSPRRTIPMDNNWVDRAGSADDFGGWPFQKFVGGLFNIRLAENGGERLSAIAFSSMRHS